ncbi:MAG: 16S rRNA (uracil(1498)-N(3))-methyltransferase [Pseudomonadota bacterium]|nr:16S rRNA (uracil(1498)-N(3))-methyltransferase [Pseudomonadota bacterium]
MKHNRIYQETPLLCDTEITLDAGATHHLTRVLRCRIDDRIELFNGDGRCYSASIQKISKRHTVARVITQSSVEADPPLDIHLGLPLSKGQRMDFAMQKAVELGVSAITPLMTERTVVKLSQKRLQQKQQHWRQVIISACEQSGRCRLPLLHPLATLDAWAQQQIHYGIVLDPQATDSLASLPAPAAGSTLQLVCGPEGGLSRDEINQLTQHHFNPVRMGPRILRTETAPLAAIAAIQMLWGDFR